jgi:hypothetical protein
LVVCLFLLLFNEDWLRVQAFDAGGGAIFVNPPLPLSLPLSKLNNGGGGGACF